ncbi:MAG: hypothetical protein H6836_08825 [Planctomycetes bacterium]|nr:hypothetical protein [Planctomycetota bacterium]
MRRRALGGVALLGLVGLLGAQAKLVSPAFYVDEEGSTAGAPFGNTIVAGGLPQRTQQVMGDLRGRSRVFRSLSFRRDGEVEPTAFFGVRVLDFELHLGHGNFATAGPTFSANYRLPRARVFARRALSLPSLVDLPRIVPAPFDVTVPFDSPFPYNGVDDLVWESNVYSQLGGA